MHKLQQTLDTLSRLIAESDALETDALGAKRSLESLGGNRKAINELAVALTYFALARKRLVDARIIAEVGQQTFNFPNK